jgi:hypothetical protein
MNVFAWTGGFGCSFEPAVDVGLVNSRLGCDTLPGSWNTMNASNPATASNRTAATTILRRRVGEDGMPRG